MPGDIGTTAITTRPLTSMPLTATIGTRMFTTAITPTLILITLTATTVRTGVDIDCEKGISHEKSLARGSLGDVHGFAGRLRDL